MMDQIIIVVCEVLIGLFLWMYYRSRQKSLNHEITLLSRKINTLEGTGNGPLCPVDDQMRKDELLARFENAGSLELKTAERYRHIIRLERSGFDAREVADILEVSESEAEQMLFLARYSRQSGEPAGC